MAAEAPSKSKRTGPPHWEMLAIALAVLALSLTLEVRSDERVAFAAMPSHPLPETCGCRAVLGIPCPGCGLTRSFVHLVHGRWTESWRSHHLGWLLAGALVFQFPYRFAALRWPERVVLSVRFRRWFARSVIALLIANWLIVLGSLAGYFNAG